MFTINNEEIGKYLRSLIEKKGWTHRQFCKEYLKLRGGETESLDDELQNMQNRLSQILKGKKGIQIYDLPIFTELLGTSCEDLLSCGKCIVPNANHVTNYNTAFSKDPQVWERYVEREDKLILNCDEYGNTVLDYIFQFKNYSFLKYLMDKGYIWFTDNNGWNWHNYGAGTNIKRREIGNIDTALPLQIQYEDQVRIQAITLAIENEDIGTLNSLHARENPALHAISFSLDQADTNKYYNKELITSVANANEKILMYFSEEFKIQKAKKGRDIFIFPYIGQVIDLMLLNQRKEVELLIKKAIKHNRKTYENLKNMIDDAYETTCKTHSEPWGFKPDEEMCNSLMKRILANLSYTAKKDMVSFYYSPDGETVNALTTNIVKITNTSKTLILNELISELNLWYNKIIHVREELSLIER